MVGSEGSRGRAPIKRSLLISLPPRTTKKKKKHTSYDTHTHTHIPREGILIFPLALPIVSGLRHRLLRCNRLDLYGVSLTM